MIHSLFVINHSGDIFMEKHWRSIIPRTVMDYFFEAQRQVITSTTRDSHVKNNICNINFTVDFNYIAFQVVKDNKGHEDVPSVIATPHHYLISIYRNGLFFVAVCMSEGIKYK